MCTPSGLPGFLSNITRNKMLILATSNRRAPNGQNNIGFLGCMAVPEWSEHRESNSPSLWHLLPFRHKSNRSLGPADAHVQVRFNSNAVLADYFSAGEQVGTCTTSLRLLRRR